MSPRLLLPTLLLTVALAVPAGAAEPDTTAARRLIVGFHEMPDARAGDRYMGERIMDLDAPLRFIVVETRDPGAFEARARSDENARYVEENVDTFRTFLVPNDALYSNSGHWGTKKIGAQAAWDRTLGATSVKVAVIDTGLRRTHEDFAGQSRILAGYDTIDEDTTPQDTCGHGTHVAGTIGATINNGKGIAGLAQVSIYPIRALTSILVDCTGNSGDLAQALRRAGDEGAHFSSNSWGGGGGSAITDAINYAHGKGTIHVAAAGNDGSCTNCVSEPWKSNAAKVIVVSSTTSSDGLSGFSSQGPQVDVAAPGSSIISAYNGGDSSYATLSGTSMATPHVTGVAALVKTLNPSWGYADIDNRLKTTAVDLGSSGKDDKFGYGRINADAAVGTGTPLPNSSPTACFTHSFTFGMFQVDGSCSSDPDGSVVSWSWNWGDGTAAGSGVTASHTYASAGDYTVTLTVTDDDGATNAVSATITVTADPDPGATTISNGATLAVTSGVAGTDQFFKISVPSGRSLLRVTIDGPDCGTPLPCTPDLDLSVRKGARPTDTAYDCRVGLVGSDEECLVADPDETWYYVRVHVTAGSGVAYEIFGVWV